MLNLRVYRISSFLCETGAYFTIVYQPLTVVKEAEYSHNAPLYGFISDARQGRKENLILKSCFINLCYHGKTQTPTLLSKYESLFFYLMSSKF